MGFGGLIDIYIEMKIKVWLKFIELNRIAIINRISLDKTVIKTFNNHKSIKFAIIIEKMRIISITA